jgi:PAS domain S-box-containing protein
VKKNTRPNETPTNNVSPLKKEKLEEKVEVLERRVTYLDSLVQIQRSFNLILGKLGAGKPLKSILTELIQAIENTRPNMLGAVLLVDEDGKELRNGVAPSLPDFYQEAVEGLSIGPDVGCCGTAAYTQELCVVDDILTNPSWERFRDLVAEIGLKSCWSHPIISSDKRVLGTFAMYYRDHRSSNQDEVELIQDAAHIAGIAIERKLGEDALKASEQRFRGIVDNAPFVFFLKDEAGRFRVANRGFENWYGCAIAEIEGKTSEEAETGCFPRHSEEFDREVLRTGQVHESENEIALADGSLHSIISTKFPIFSGEGDALGVGTIQVDVTEQRRTETQMRQAQKMEAIGQLTGGIAHDFNNVMAVIQGHSEFLADRLGGDDKSVQAIARTVKRGTDLTQNLLAFSRRQPLNNKVVDVRSLITSVSELLARTLGETIVVSTQFENRSLRVETDPGQLENAIVNLAINARDAMAHGGEIRVKAALVRLESIPCAPSRKHGRDEYVEIAVSDNGAGMSAETAKRAFEPFFTTKGVGKGTGLGLSMVYGFIKQSDGQVFISSEEGEGTTVKLLLPYSETEPDDDVETNVSEQTGTGETILVIEDSTDVRELVVTILERLGYRVLQAHDGRSAMLQFASIPEIDLVLTDVVLPGDMNGPDIAKNIQRSRPGTKVIYMSGYAEKVEIQSSLDKKVTFINKPMRRSELASKVRLVLDR